MIPSAIPAALVDNAFVDGKLNYQMVTFAVALGVLAITYALTPKNARRFCKPGSLNGRASGHRLEFLRGEAICPLLSVLIRQS